MHIWLLLIFRELLFLGLVTALGAGPAAFLSERFDRPSRLAMAPALGLCLGVCLTSTVAYKYPGQETAPLLVAAAALSIAVGAFRRPPALTRPSLSGLLQPIIVIVVILGSFTAPLASRGTVGPVGGYQVADTSGYISEINTLERDSIKKAEHLRPPYANLEDAYVTPYVAANQQLDLAPLEANYNSLLGLGATDTQSAFLIAVLLVGALGVFAVVRTAAGGSGWPAVLAGCLFAGPMFVELLMEGSQAAIAGSALLAPVVGLGLEAAHRRNAANIVLLGLVAAGLQTVYPLFVPCIVIGGAVTLAVLAIREWRTGELSRRGLAASAAALGSVLTLSVILTPVAFARNTRYWISILKGSFSFVGLPRYDLPVPVLPGWLLQTRDFYGLVDIVDHATTSQLLLAGAMPLLLLAVITLAVIKTTIARVILGVVAGASLLAMYSLRSQDCSYCVQRSLLPVGALAPVTIGLGVAALAALRRSTGLWAAALIALVTILVIGHEGLVERRRLSQGDYILDQADRQALAALPSAHGPVELEGFAEGPLPPMELPLVYNLVEEQTNGGASLPTIVDEGRGLLYLTGTSMPLGPSFRANYQYVLTHLPDVLTQRQTVARYGAIALQRRTSALDVTLISGVEVAPARLDPTGTAWVDPAAPLQLLVLGDQAGRAAWVSLTLRATVPVTVVPGPGVISHRRVGHELQICLRALGDPPVRSAAVMASYAPTPAPGQPDSYSLPLPARGLSLQSMRVSTTSCATRHRLGPR